MSMENRRIGIIGHSRAGKTTVLTCLKSAFLSRGWNATDQSGSGQSHLSRCAQRILNGLWPEPTDPSTSIPTVDFDIDNAEAGVGFSLRFHDPSGELFDQPLPEEHPFFAARQQIIDDLVASYGIIVMVDRSRRPGEIDDLLTRNLGDVLSRMPFDSNGKRRLNKRVAVLFTKSDTLSWQRKVRIPLADDWVQFSGELPENLWARVNQIAGEGNVHFFFCSASGWYSGMPNIRTAVQPRPFAASQLNGEMNGETFPRSGSISNNGDHLPDPPQPASDGYDSETISNSSSKLMSCLPIFSDPLRIAGQRIAGKVREDFFERSIYRIRDADRPGHGRLVELSDARSDWIGVHELPGRAVEEDTHYPLMPWNLVEPLLWVVGLGDLP